MARDLDFTPPSPATPVPFPVVQPSSLPAALLEPLPGLATQIYPPPSLTVQPQELGLLTDLYQLTMAACYRAEGLDQRPASFELVVRRLPEGFGYLVAMGLAQALAYLEQLCFPEEYLSALRATGVFDQVQGQGDFWAQLQAARFTGDVWAVPEGTVVFANEPLLRIEAPLWQAQIVETYLLNTLNYQTLIATRAARLRQAAGPEAKLLEFGSRRAFSPQAALWAARAALAAGLDATSNVLAALKLGRTPSGTMAHALVMALAALEGSEAEAFTAFHRSFPGAALLIDTYDPIAAAQGLAQRVQAGETIPAVRLDSGDLVSLSQTVRSLLPDTQILASGDLDEAEITRLRQAGACLDGYGIGTKLVTGAPVNGVYKLVEIDGIPVMKEAAGKLTYPGRKQIFRGLQDGSWQSDRLGLADEGPTPSEITLLQPVMRQGQRLLPDDSLEAIAQRCQTQVTQLPADLRTINAQPPDIKLSQALRSLIHQTRKH